MKIFKLLLLLTFGLWADFELDIPNDVNVSILHSDNNREFLKEIKEVYEKPIYRDIRSLSFSNFENNITQQIIKQDIEHILPLYINTQNIFEEKVQGTKLFFNVDNSLNHSKKHPLIAINIFLKVLTKYIAFLRLEKRNKEANVILNQTLRNIDHFMQESHTLLNYSGALAYYENVIKDVVCNGLDIQAILLDNKPMKEDIFFIIVKRESMINYNNIKNTFMKYKNVDYSNDTNRKIGLEVIRLYKIFSDKYQQKMIDAIKMGSKDVIKNHEKYMEQELDNEIKLLESFSYKLKLFYVDKLLYINNILSIESDNFKYIAEEKARMLALVIPSTHINVLYVGHKEILLKYNTLLGTCK